MIKDSVNTLSTVLPDPAYQSEAAGVSVYQGDCLELLALLGAAHPDGLFDAIFADPPYFLSNGGVTCHSGKMVKVDKGAWDATRGLEANHAFNAAWLALCQALLRKDGTLWVTGTSHAFFSVGFAMQQLGFKLLNDITWEKPNPPPNLSCRYFTHATETVIWAAKNKKSRHCFNYDAMKDLNRGKQMKSVWRMKAAGAGEKAHGKHPAQKPVALVERCLLASTKPGDRVLDPFLGGGTTAVACIKLKRQCLGIESDPGFVAQSIRRIKETRADPPDWFPAVRKRR